MFFNNKNRVKNDLSVIFIYLFIYFIEDRDFI